MSQREAQARILINKMLEDAKWLFFPTADGKANIICEDRILGRDLPPNANLGDDFERATGGIVDYLLLNDQDRAIGLVEAKRESIHPLDAKEQALDYTQGLGICTRLAAIWGHAPDTATPASMPTREVLQSDAAAA
jgi:type I restriction enzyme, R subunit